MLLFASYAPCLHGKDKQSNFPSKGLLEFLAEMEEVDGELISAVDLIQANESATLEQTKTTEKAKLLVVKSAQSSSEMLSEKQQKTPNKANIKELNK